MTQTNAIVVRNLGGPEVLKFEQIELSPPSAGEVQIRHTAIGLNFIDVYFRTGLYPALGGLPFIPGNEGAGVIVDLGSGINGLAVGDRVAYASGMGAYSEARNIEASRVIKIPEGVSDQQAGAMMLKGMTAEYLLCRTFEVKAGQTILIHAAAGGVGLIAGQWAKHLGATVIGTAGSPEKVALALANGYDHVIDYTKENFVSRVRELTGGKGVDAAYDSVGKTTWLGSLDCIKPFGMFVSFGQSSGALEGFTLAHLMQRGSLYAARPSLNAYTSTRVDLELSANRLFDVVRRGIVNININQTFALKNADEAHCSLEARNTTGATVLVP
jgi:NADPH:quinone reductase